MATEREKQLEKMLSDSMELSNRRDKQINDQNKQINDLITQMQRMPQYGGELRAVMQPAQQDPQAVRAERIQRLTLGLRKSNKIRDFKDTAESDIRLWLQRFDFEIAALKVMVGINDDLSRDEIIPLLKDKLDYTIVKRLDSVFTQRNPVLQWNAVTKDQLHKCLIEEFGSKQNDISQVLAQFGPNRFKKSPNMSVSEFYYKWYEQLPEALKPSTDAERINYVDLINRSLFYFCLEDKYIQEQLCNLKEADPKLKTYLDEATAAEARRKSFEEIGTSSSVLDSSSAVSMSKFYGESSKKKPFHKYKDKKGSGESFQTKKGADAPGPKGAQPETTHRPSKADTDKVSTGNKGNRPPKRIVNCNYCQKPGHWAKDCFKRIRAEGLKTSQISNMEVTESTGNVSVNQFLLHVSAVQDSSKVDTFATKVVSPLITNDPLLTRICVEGVAMMTFEIDTAASHSLISQDVFNRIQGELKFRGRKLLKPLDQQVSIKLADGSTAAKNVATVQMNIATSENSKEKVLATFFILEGPNNLLSRHSVMNLWPATYKAFVRDTNCKKLGQIQYTDANTGTVRSVQVQQKGKSDNICKTDKEKSGQSKSDKVKPTKVVVSSNQKADTTMSDKEKSEQSKSVKVKPTKVVASSQQKAGTTMTDKEKSVQSKSGKVKPTGKPLGDKSNVSKNGELSMKTRTRLDTKNSSKQGTNQVVASSHQWGGAADKVVQPITPRKVAQATTAKGKTGGRKSLNDLQSSHKVSKTQSCQQNDTEQGKGSGPEWPERKELPQLPEGEITQEVGEAYCRQICQMYPSVFDGGKGVFKGAEATMYVKPGHLEKIKQGGLRSAAKVPYGLQDQYDVKLEELYEDLTPIDGKDLITASQVVPVCKVGKDGKKVIKRLAINYKSTINSHLRDIPSVFSTCSEQLDKLKDEYRTCIDLKGAFKQIPVTPGFSQKLLAVVTPRGFATPSTMQFDIKTAPAIWQNHMQKLIHGMNGKGPIKAAVVVDDVCISGDTP